MEALAALGLACNIIQLAGIATKSVTICKQAYEHGSTIEHLEYKTNCADLRKAYIVLEQSLNTSQSQQDARIRAIAKKYIETSKQLDEELRKLDPRPAAGSSTNKLRQWGKAVRSTWKAGRIDDIKAKLDEYEKVMDTQILVRLSVLLQGMDTSTRESMVNTDQRLDVMSQKLVAGITCIQDLTVSLEQKLHRIEAGLDVANLRIDEVKIAISSESYRKKFRDLEASLMFDGMHLRQESIKEQHQETCQWIFRDVPSAKWSNFTHWLQQSDQLYWIFGKPGSGKSTLMNYLVQDSRVVELLSRDHAATSFIAYYFFSELGPSPLHRSITGLLRSLLLQLLGGPDKDVLQRWILEQRPDILDTSSWSEKSLIGLIKGFHSLIRRQMCYFVDGLDECDDSQSLLEMMKSFASVSTLKICASSRPERVFEAEFDTSHKLKLEDFTRDDIDAYIKDRLKPAVLTQRQNIRMQVETENLIKEIGNMAEGVFLWVYIVVRLLNDGFRDGDDIELLRKRLHKLPTRIFDLYSDMWNRTRETHDLYAEFAAMYFHLILCGGDVSLFQFALANDPRLCDRLLQPDHVTRIQKFREKLADYDLLIVRIATRCAGLIEVRGHEEPQSESVSQDVSESEGDSEPYKRDEADSQPPQIWQRVQADLQAPFALSSASELWAHEKTRVCFIHRSVKEFLIQDERGLNLLSHHQEGFQDAWTRISKAFLALKALGVEDLRLKDVQLFLNMTQRCTATSTSMSMDAKVLCDAVVSNLKLFEHTYSTIVAWLAGISKCDWYECLQRNSDNQGISPKFLNCIIVRSNGNPGFFEFVLQSLRDHSRRDYLSLLLFDLTRRMKHSPAQEWSEDGWEKALELLKVLLDRGGDLNMGFVEAHDPWIYANFHHPAARVSSPWANLMKTSGVKLDVGTWEMLHSYGARFPAKQFGCFVFSGNEGHSFICMVIEEAVHRFPEQRCFKIVLLCSDMTWCKVSSEDAVMLQNIIAPDSELSTHELREYEQGYLTDFAIKGLLATAEDICGRSIAYASVQEAFASFGVSGLTEQDWEKLSYSTRKPELRAL